MLNLLKKRPSGKSLKRLLILSIILFAVVYPAMTYFFLVSQYPVSFMESQLSFSGEVLKSHYEVTDIGSYRIAQVLDYGFMVSYGILSFSLALIIARKFDEGSTWFKSGLMMAVFGISAAICDGIENGFILAMLTDPINFPNAWAVIHSIFALVKYIFLITCIAWAIIASLVRLAKKD